jgi:hypothetical protein
MRPETTSIPTAEESQQPIHNGSRRKGKRLRVLGLLFAAALACGGLAGCQAGETAQEEPPVQSAPAVSQPVSTDPEPADKETSDTPETPPEGEDGFSFAQLEGYDFIFASGVGAWATSLKIDADGSFSGAYYDSDMGDTGEGYPGGTQYNCVFQGQFTPPVQVNEYTYSTRIDAIRYDREVGTDEIRDDIHYVYTEPAGLEGAEEVLIYLPGAPLDQLPQDYLDWIGYFDLSTAEETALSGYGLYNVATECGFSGYLSPS